MKKYLLAILLVLCLTLQASAGVNMMVAGSGAGGGVDYTQDAHCQLALLMTANTGDETDVSTNGYTMTESTGDDIPTAAAVPASYSGTSRDWTASDNEWLLCTDANCPNLDFSGADQTMSVCAWIKAETAPADTVKYMIVAKTNAWDDGWELSIEGSGSSQFEFVFHLYDESLHSTTTTYNINTQYHVCAIYDDSNMMIFVDGEGDGSFAYEDGLPTNSNAEVRIGARDHVTVFNTFDGLIDEVIVFDDAITTGVGSELEGIYTNGIDGSKGASG